MPHDPPRPAHQGLRHGADARRRARPPRLRGRHRRDLRRRRARAAPARARSPQCVNLLERPTSGSRRRERRRRSPQLGRAASCASRAAASARSSSPTACSAAARRPQNVALPLEYLGVTRGRDHAPRRRAARPRRTRRQGRPLPAPAVRRSAPARRHRPRPRAAPLACCSPTRPPRDSTPRRPPRSSTLLKELRDDLGLSILFITHEMDTVRAGRRLRRPARSRPHRRVGTARSTCCATPRSTLGRALQSAASGRAPARAAVTEWRVSYARDGRAGGLDRPRSASSARDRSRCSAPSIETDRAARPSATRRSRSDPPTSATGSSTLAGALGPVDPPGRRPRATRPALEASHERARRMSLGTSATERAARRDPGARAPRARRDADHGRHRHDDRRARRHPARRARATTSRPAASSRTAPRTPCSAG